MIDRRTLLGAACGVTFVPAAFAVPKEKPALFLIGDSTIRNGTQDNGATAGQFGWGHMMKYYFDTDRIFVVNDAMGGTSSRSFQTAPNLWPKVLQMIRPGDFVLMAFGHNDSRGSLKGNGDETGLLPPSRAKPSEAAPPAEEGHSFGWYMRQYVRQTRAKGATPIVLSLIPRNRWTGAKVNRNSADYALWARQAAAQEHAQFIALNELIADRYDKIGQARVTAEFFPPNEAVHPNWAGAAFNAGVVIEGLRKLDTPLKKYLRKHSHVPAAPDIVPPAIGERGPTAMEPSSRMPQ